MFFIAGINPSLRQLGRANGACPACRESGRLYIVKQAQNLSVFFIPLFSFGGEYIVTCGSCASVMALRKGVGKRIERDPDMPLDPYDLQIVKDNHGGRCPNCGWRANTNYSFCPGCGGRL